jgi:hypothetical protein
MGQPPSHLQALREDRVSVKGRSFALNGEGDDWSGSEWSCTGEAQQTQEPRID